MKLTGRTVEGLSPADKATTYFDADLKGFGVRVMPPSARAPRGSRAWIVEYRPGAGGRGVAKRRLALGSTSTLDAAAARSMAKDVLARVRMGEDPAAARGDDRRSATVAELATVYQRETAVGRKRRTIELYESYWRLWVLPELGSTKVKNVSRADVTRLHRKVGEAHPTTANRVVTLIAHFYAWASKNTLVTSGFNPANAVDRFKESARERYLSGAELKRLGATMAEAETVGIPWPEKPGVARSKHAPKPDNRRTSIDPHAAAAIRLLLFTGARLREILHLRWSEVDLERGILLLADSKTGRKTIILGSAALQVIADLDKVGDFVIAGAANDRPRSDLQRPWRLVSERAGLSGVRLHDLRHTFASYGAAGGLGLPVIGGLLGHADTKTTARYAHLANDPLRRASESISSEIAAAFGKATNIVEVDGH